MPNELAIILTSHGSFAEGALACAEMLIGSQENIAVISITMDSTTEGIQQQFVDTYHQLNNSNGILILADILGGTPCNQAAQLALTKENIILYSGFNMPVLLEALTNRHLTLQQLSELIEEIFPQSCINVLGTLTQSHQSHHSDPEQL